MLNVFLIVVGGSIGFFVLMWCIVYALQFFRPDGPMPLHKDADLVRRIQLKAGKEMRVQFTDIRSLEKSRVLIGPEEEDYMFADGLSTGWPEGWMDDLHRRRN